MTREQAYKTLNLQEGASMEDVEAAYQKLVRRYPPEFNPQRFVEIQGAYRYLTSFTKRLEALFATMATTQGESPKLETNNVEPEDVEAYLEQTLQEALMVLRINHIYNLYLN